MLPIPKEIRDEANNEVTDLSRRYIRVLTSSVKHFETETYIGFRCLTSEDGISITLLTKLGYVLEPSEITAMSWITLRTRFDKPKNKWGK